MKFSLKLLSILLAFTMIFSQLMPAAYAGGKPSNSGTIDYVALGDSIATGTIHSFLTITPYPTYFYDYLKSANPNQRVTFKNLSYDGDRTNELLAKLNTNKTIISAVKGAEVLTLSIGGNNLMQAAKNNSLIGYDFFNVNETIAEQGLTDFSSQWPQIISRIKELNPNAKLIVTNSYNPYNQLDANGDRNAYMHNLVNDYLYRTGNGINTVIDAYSFDGSRYKIADVYHSYYAYSISNNMGSIDYLYPASFTRNPHPRASGQSMILELIKQAYIQ